MLAVIRSGSPSPSTSPSVIPAGCRAVRYAIRLRKLPSPLPNNTETVADSKSTVTRSAFRSPLRSPATIRNGLTPTRCFTGTPNRGTAALARPTPPTSNVSVASDTTEHAVIRTAKADPERPGQSVERPPRSAQRCPADRSRRGGRSAIFARGAAMQTRRPSPSARTEQPTESPRLGRSAMDGISGTVAVRVAVANRRCVRSLGAKSPHGTQADRRTLVTRTPEPPGHPSWTAADQKFPSLSPRGTGDSAQGPCRRDGSRRCAADRHQTPARAQQPRHHVDTCKASTMPRSSTPSTPAAHRWSRSARRATLTTYTTGGCWSRKATLSDRGSGLSLAGDARALFD